MAEDAEVFNSAIIRELRNYREEVKNALLTLGIFPIEQTNFGLAHGPLTAKLHSLITPCDAVIHLAGFYYYGAEPSQRLYDDVRCKEGLAEFSMDTGPLRNSVGSLIQDTGSFLTDHYPVLRTGVSGRSSS
jgi:hypothetical protein